MSQTINVELDHSIIYVYGTVNGEAVTFTLVGEGVWQTIVDANEDNTYVLHIEAYSALGLELVYTTTLYYGFTPPKTTWAANEYETPANWNRQKSNIEFIATETLPSLYYFPAHELVDAADPAKLPKISLVNRLEGNLAGIETCGIPLPAEWQNSKTWPTCAPSFADFNRWERNAKLIYDMAARIRIRWRPSGTFTAGQDNILPRRV